MVESLTRDQGTAGSSLTSVTLLCPSARHSNPCLVLVQPRKTHPFITDRLLMGCKESNQTNKLQKIVFFFQLCIQNNPTEARNMLLQNPQLAYALLQAQIVMKIVDPQVAMVRTIFIKVSKLVRFHFLYISFVHFELL